jgi:hypothetical protein
MPAVYVPDADAERTIEEIAAPQLAAAAAAIAPRIVENVPVHHGGAKATYHTEVSAGTEAGRPQARVMIASPFWHFLEYGTRFNAPYRPIQRAVESLGLPYLPR